MNYINQPDDKYRNRKGQYPDITGPYPKDPHSPWDRGHKDPQPYSRPITIGEVFPFLDRLSIGWSPLLDTLKEVTTTKPAYPPYDILEVDSATNLLQVAVAGFTKKELEIVLQDSVLTVTGKKKTKQKGEVIYRGIAARDFELKFAVAEYWEIDSAEVTDGMLAITFKKELPEEKKPKVIEIK